MFQCLQTIWVSMLDGILPLNPLLSTPEPNLESESGDIVFSDCDYIWKEHLASWTQYLPPYYLHV